MFFMSVILFAALIMKIPGFFPDRFEQSITDGTGLK